MRAKRRRLLITPSDEVWKLLEEVHQLTGNARAAVVSEILDEVAPVFQTQIEALRVLKDSPLQAQRLMQNFASESVARLMHAQLDLSDELDKLDARTVKGKRAKTGGLRGRPT